MPEVTRGGKTLAPPRGIMIGSPAPGPNHHDCQVAWNLNQWQSDSANLTRSRVPARGSGPTCSNISYKVSWSCAMGPGFFWPPGPGKRGFRVHVSKSPQARESGQSAAAARAAAIMIRVLPARALWLRPPHRPWRRLQLRLEVGEQPLRDIRLGVRSILTSSLRLSTRDWLRRLEITCMKIKRCHGFVV